MTDPLSGRDGTQAVGGADALAPAPRTADDALPALPVAADEAGAARWMDADAAESRRRSDPPARAEVAPRAEVEVAGGRAGRVRDAGPARLLPPTEAPAPTRRMPGKPPSPLTPAPGPDVPPEPEGGDEPEWLRVRREEHEFRSLFGEWRAGSGPVRRSSGLSPVTLLVLLVLVAIVVVIALS